MEIEGKIIRDLPLQEGTSKAGNLWRKKEWVMETPGTYPRQVFFNSFGDKIDQNPLEIGKSYAISVDIESREWNGRWYTDVRAYASRPLDQNTGMGAMPQDYGNPPFGGNEPQANFGTQQTGFASSADQTDDLPF